MAKDMVEDVTYTPNHLKDCKNCKHFISVGKTEWYKCKAFPDGIPMELIANGHFKIIKGQKGNYTFTPKKLRSKSA